MNNSSVVAEFVDPDPTSALFFGIWCAAVSAIAVPLNLFILTATIKVKEIRRVPCNMFIGNLALSDALFMLSFSLHLPYALTGSETLCKATGFFIGIFTVLFIWMAPFLAVNRYAVVCRQQEKLARTLSKAFSRKGICCMILILWTFDIAYSLPFIILDANGLHNAGICGISMRVRNSVSLYGLGGTLGIGIVSYIPWLLSYRKVSIWIKRMSARLSLSAETNKTIEETRNIIRLTKWITVLPIMCNFPATFALVLPEFDTNIISIGIGRLLFSSFPLIPLINAIITLKFVRPYRLAFKKHCRRSTITSILFSWIIEGRSLSKVHDVRDNNILVVASKNLSNSVR